MKIEIDRIYINGLLEPLISKFDKRYASYQYRMIPTNTKSELYQVDINGLKDRTVDNNKFNMLAKVDLFDNSNCSHNITDLFSFLDYEPSDNVTTYTNYSKIRNLPYCLDALGLLDLRESYKPLALQNISIKLYIDIYEKQTNLLNILSH